MEKIIVTGANGFIGRYAVARMTAGGYRVCAVDRIKAEDNSDRVESIEMDLSDCRDIAGTVGSIGTASAMIHLAADITVPGNLTTIGNNIGSMITALETARLKAVKHFIYLSSIPVIGEIQYTPIDETHPVHPRTPYHWSKLLGEEMLARYRDTFETITILRIPSPVGAGMRRSVFLPLLIDRMLRGEDVEVYGSGERIQNYIDVRDIAEALFRTVRERSDGLYLIAGRESISNLSLAETIRRITRSGSIISCGKHPDPEESEKWIISAEKARKDFGFSPAYDLESTIRWMCEEMK